MIGTGSITILENYNNLLAKLFLHLPCTVSVTNGTDGSGGSDGGGIVGSGGWVIDLSLKYLGNSFDLIGISE